MRKGKIMWDYVEVENCSQRDTFNAAIKFDGANGVRKEITNSAFHSGEGMGVHIKSSMDILLENNVFVNFTSYGIWAQSS